MTTPTIEQRARNAAEDLQHRASIVSREHRPTVPDLERRVTRRRFATAGAILAVALVAAVSWLQATGPAPPPMVSDGAEPTSQHTSGATPPEAAPVEYADGQILARPLPGDTAPPVSAEPDVDSCFGPGKALDVVTLVVGPDAEVTGLDSATGCIVAWGHQRLRIAAHDGDYPAFTAELAGWRFRLAPDQAVVLDLTAEEYLQPGIHQVESDFGPARAIVWWPPPADPSVGHP